MRWRSRMRRDLGSKESALASSRNTNMRGSTMLRLATSNIKSVIVKRREARMRF